MWRLLNERYFEGKLRPVRIMTTGCDELAGFFDDNPYPHIGLSRKLNVGKDAWGDSLLHEMIHQYLWENKVFEWYKHGPEFMELGRKFEIDLSDECIG